MSDCAIRTEVFGPDERRVLAPYFTNLDGPVFALTNLPETVKGALFARYSRSPKSLRRLFLDEFTGRVERGHAVPSAADAVGIARAEKLYDRVFSEYGDDSVAQLGGVHLACEEVSNVLTKAIEWGRLAAYLEQSTRYIAYTDRPGGCWRYHVPQEIGDGALAERYRRTLDLAFDTYARWLGPMQAHFSKRYPKSPNDSDTVHRTAIRAKSLDTLRGLLPAATRSNVGIYATGQAYEALLLRLRAHPLAEAHHYADLALAELRKVIPTFLARVDQPERGLRWSAYLADTRRATEVVAGTVLDGIVAEPRPEVVLTDFDPDGEIKVVAAALYAASAIPDDQLLAIARRMTTDERMSVLRAYVGQRTNRRHTPGRAFERTSYRFDLLADYGAFRDLQRHRLLTLEWQLLSTRHGYTQPEAIVEAGALSDWQRVMDHSAELYEALRAAYSPVVASYSVAMAYRVRFYLEMNAREAMHLIELRTAPQGHPSYRRICQTLHRLIAEQAGHRAIADAMIFADHSVVELERLEAERTKEQKRSDPGGDRS